MDTMQLLRRKPGYNWHCLCCTAAACLCCCFCYSDGTPCPFAVVSSKTRHQRAPTGPGNLLQHYCWHLLLQLLLLLSCMEPAATVGSASKPTLWRSLRNSSHWHYRNNAKITSGIGWHTVLPWFAASRVNVIIELWWKAAWIAEIDIQVEQTT